jgi:hypothetical protein
MGGELALAQSSMAERVKATVHRSGHRILINALPVQEGYEDRDILTQPGIRVPQAFAQIDNKF